jgi:hypothetical protein
VRRLALIVSVAAVLVGCGKKGPPLPPLPPHPVEAGPTQVRQAGPEMEIWIPLPTGLMNEKPIERFRGVRLYRISRDLTGAEGAVPRITAQDFSPKLDPVATLEGEEAGALVPGELWRYREAVGPLAPPEGGSRLVAYSVRFQVKGRRWSPYSTPASLVVGAVVPPPREFTAEPGPGGASLSWTAGMGEASTAIYRTTPGVHFPFAPMTVADPGFDRWVDPTVAEGQEYEYAIRTLVGEGRRARLSSAAGPLRMTMVDRFPPAPPQRLTALGRPGGVDLFWSPGDEIDLAGYRVYRRRLPGGTWELVTPETLISTTWVDTAVEPGERFAYAVTAIDFAEPPNESRRSEVKEVSVPVPPPPAEELAPAEPVPVAPGGEEPAEPQETEKKDAPEARP